MLKLRFFLFAFVFSTFTTFVPSCAMEMSREKEIIDCRAIVLCQPDNQLVGSKFDRDAFEQAYHEMVGNDDPKIKALYQEACEYLLSNSKSSLEKQEKAKIQAAFEAVFSAMINENDRGVQVRNWCTFKDLLAKGVNPNVFSKDRYFTPLLYACVENELEAVKLLLKCPAIDINLRSSRFISCTPLEIACRRGNDEIVQLLLEAGADSKDGANLFLSVLGGCRYGSSHHTVVKLLLQYGANPNMETLCGETSLFWAKNFEEIQMLIEGGANVNHRRSDGMSVLDCQLKRLCENASTKDKDVDKYISLLVKSGCKINSQDPKGYTALHCILQDSRIDLTKMLYLDIVPALFNHGANPMIKDNQGRTAFDCVKKDSVKDVLKASCLSTVEDKALLLLGAKNANGREIAEFDGEK